VRGHALDGRERLDDRPDAREPVGREALHGDGLQERLEAETADGVVLTSGEVLPRRSG